MQRETINGKWFLMFLSNRVNQDELSIDYRDGPDQFESSLYSLNIGWHSSRASIDYEHTLTHS
jgi:hypothetical protein